MPVAFINSSNRMYMYQDVTYSTDVLALIQLSTKTAATVCRERVGSPGIKAEFTWLVGVVVRASDM